MKIIIPINQLFNNEQLFYDIYPFVFLIIDFYLLNGYNLYKCALMNFGSVNTLAHSIQ
jgi:hypothetical protein